MKTISPFVLKNKLGEFCSVENAPSRNGENQAPNQFILKFENGVVFQSYTTLIGAKIKGQLYLSESHTYSNTTSRFCGQWCGLNARERRNGLKDGEIIFITP